MALKPVVADYSGKLRELTAGDVITPVQLGSGAANTTTFLRGDNTWATPSGVGGGTAGITRSINNIAAATTGAAMALVDYVYICTGTFPYTQPTAMTNTNLYTIKNAGTGVITILFTLTENADDSTLINLNPGVSLSFISNNTNWVII